MCRKIANQDKSLFFPELATQSPLLLFCLLFLLSTMFGCLDDFGTMLLFVAPEIFDLNCHQQQQQQQQQPPPCVLISYEELRAATKNFHHGNKIGEGIFGTVYKVHLPRKKIVVIHNNAIPYYLGRYNTDILCAEMLKFSNFIFSNQNLWRKELYLLKWKFQN